MSGRDISAFIGHVVMAMHFGAEFIDGMTLDDFLADRKTRDVVIRRCIFSGYSTHLPWCIEGGAFVSITAPMSERRRQRKKDKTK